MSLSIKNLTKKYDRQLAVNNISFEISKGEIVGFLGPNGAGKSTTMKIATGFLQPTSGSVKIGQYDVEENPLAAKRITGYLPEHNPLYLDLYVHEYLRFAGSLFGLKGSALKSRVGAMIELCGLSVEQNKRIEALSKGYRQRVGLAQALLHDPQVLILDEPTSGLDPNQIMEIRKVIKEISGQKTVLFSTHIMQEVQALCDRVVVIHKSELVANDSLSNLLGKEKKTSAIVVEFEKDVSEEDLRGLKGVQEVIKLTATSFRIIPVPSADVRPELFRLASEKNFSLVGLKQEENSLENIFKELTDQSVSQ